MIIKGNKKEGVTDIHFCCGDMMESVISNGKIKINRMGFIHFPSMYYNRKVSYCPFCGKKNETFSD